MTSQNRSENIQDNYRLEQKYDGDSPHEFDVAGFVADQTHGEKHGSRASQGGKKHQRRFRNAPGAFPLGTDFIRNGENGGNKRNSGQI